MDRCLSPKPLSQPAMRCMREHFRLAPSRCDREVDLLSTCGDNQPEFCNHSPAQLRPEGGVRELSAGSTARGRQCKRRFGDQLIELEADNLYEGPEEFGLAVSDGLTAQLTRRSHCPRERRAWKKESIHYSTWRPRRPLSVCAPRVEGQTPRSPGKPSSWQKCKRRWFSECSL